MKPSFSCAVVLCLYPTFTAPVLAQDFLDKIRPVVEFENISLANGSIQHSIAIETKPGLLYTFQSSDDLVSWNDDAVYYSLGQKLTHALRESTPPPPPDPEAPPAPAYPSAFATLLVQPSIGTSGGTVVSWRSLDDGSAVTYHIAGNMDPAWQLVPMIVCGYDNHQFFFSHPPSSVAPPAENPMLGEKDATMIAVLEDRLDEINQSLINSAYQTQHLPAPAPTAGQRRFLRVKATAVDTDGDHITDFDEFLLAAENNPLGNAFNPDADGNGKKDNEQVDTDKDGTFDAYDATPQDETAAYSLIPYARYALFEIPDGAIQINDRGTVLYYDSVWRGGTTTYLTGNGYANAINDRDMILGTMEFTWDEMIWNAACYWSGPGGGPAVVSAKHQSGDPHHVWRISSWIGDHVRTPGTVLTNDGRFPGVSTKDDTPSDAHHIWQLPIDDKEASSGAGPFYMTNMGPDGLMWGYEWDMESGAVYGKVYAPNELEGIASFFPLNVTRASLPNGKVSVFALSEHEDPDSLVHHDGSWKSSPTYGKAIDMATDGTAIGRRHEGKVMPILQNGKWHSIERSAPDLPENWKSITAELVDTTPSGWILGRHEEGTFGKAGVLLPLRLDGVPPDITAKEATGVDGISVGADNPELNVLGDPTFKPVKERLWIMAPAGSGATSVCIKAPLNQNTPLKISAPGIKFNGQDELSLSSPEQTITITATNQAGSGEDIPAQLKFGEVTSISQPIGLKIMKERLVKVTLHPIASISYPRKVAPNSRYPDLLAQKRSYRPRGTPEKSDLEAFLKRIFKPQLNAIFEVTVRTEVELEWDTATPQDFGLPSPNDSVYPHDNWLFFASDPGVEEISIHNAMKDENADINIYYMNFGASGGIFLGGVQSGQFKGVPGDGAARPSGNYLFIDSLKFMSHGEYEVPYRLHTIAHEIGHLLVGPGHPHQEDRYGMAPLKGLLPKNSVGERLMATGEAFRRPNPGCRLVKGEWDMAEKWFKARPLGDN